MRYVSAERYSEALDLLELGARLQLKHCQVFFFLLQLHWHVDLSYYAIIPSIGMSI
ncbi:hypothetical protein E1A91_D10G152200v1 [Gossypium mustelinum]|uniref:Uncharacterized protein n=2 Tax=Gossypium TaxID=3633 RepID=A0A5J5PS54_GOSBA|nr:hypothetical protein ES319_D10G148800v1 [Gossypium barbadense]KAB2009175.1 hypothetical protein ES319_D10G148800v1 [Gossypium barbadense]TYI61143.1 hypothetical protein E1A91_D10G152200v1 [Gossypium mustelinum]TYI61144.1 hypothetical protein E1A91_D10G152200v1 [Gossypium mustelinum]TYI61145.1 hypothetical protein E1A91_D10G152200v1 [Gossypium mustelinum]